MQRKKIGNQNQNVKLQKGQSKVNIMKPTNTINNSLIQKTMIKIDLKLQYLINQLNSNRKFKDYMQDLNLATKDVLMKTNHVEQHFVNSNNPEKKKNSFSIVSDIRQKTISHSNDKNTNLSSKSLKIEQQQGKIQPQFKSTTQAINSQKLEQIKQMILRKKIQILGHIELIKKKMSSSSIWDDKYFYDFTESNYEEKTIQVEQMLNITQENLQEKQKQKKGANNDYNDLSMRARSIRYSHYELKSEDGLIVDENIQVKQQILNEIKRINELQFKLSTILESKQSFQEPKQKNLNERSDKSDDNPFLQSITMLKRKMKVMQAEISAKNYLQQSKDKTHQGPQLSSNHSKIIAEQIQIFNKEVLTLELTKTKNKISMLKHQTLNLQNAIKQLEGYKALIILRNKNDENVEVKNKIMLHSDEKKVDDDQILRQILEHQFLTKFLRVKVETKFCGLMKKDIHSLSDTQINQKLHYFSNVNTFKKSVSLKIINSKDISRKDFKEDKMSNSFKKNTKISVTSSKSPKKKQTGSSAETNP